MFASERENITNLSTREVKANTEGREQISWLRLMVDANSNDEYKTSVFLSREQMREDTRCDEVETRVGAKRFETKVGKRKRTRTLKAKGNQPKLTDGRQNSPHFLDSNRLLRVISTARSSISSVTSASITLTKPAVVGSTHNRRLALISLSRSCLFTLVQP